MKLVTNFTTPIRKLLMIAFLLSITTSISAILFSYYLSIKRDELLSDSAKMEEYLVMLSNTSRNTASLNRHLMASSEIQSIRERIAKINSFTPTKGVGANQLLVVLEGIIPDGVRINRLGYSAIDGHLTLIAESNEPGHIYIFLKRLEQNPLFEPPLLQQQPGIGHNTQNTPQYEIHVATRNI